MTLIYCFLKQSQFRKEETKHQNRPKGDMKAYIDFLKNVLKSIGITLDAEQTTALDAATKDEDFAPFMAMVNNGLPSFQKKMKDTGRSEVYDEYKAIAEQTFGDAFEPTFFAELKSLKGKESFQKSLATINQQIADLKKSKKGKSDDQKDDIDERIAQLNATIVQLKEQHKNELAGKESQFSQQKLESDLAMEILMKGNLSDTFKTREFINRMMTPTVLDMLKADNYKFGDGLKIVDENGSVPYDKQTNKPIELSHYIAKAGEPYAVKSNPAPFGPVNPNTPPPQTSAYGRALVGLD